MIKTRALKLIAAGSAALAAVPATAQMATYQTYEQRAVIAREIEALFAQSEGERAANHCIKLRASLYQLGQALPRAALAGLPQAGLADWQRRFLAARARKCPDGPERPLQPVLGIGPPGGPMVLVPRPRPVMPARPMQQETVELMPIPVVAPRQPIMPNPKPTPAEPR
jgi:hypothetical protein